ncbi:MAG TPA: alpha/beta fold hydrolase [Chthoniobacterales bacterium]|nr:alpha/beta fold hydrolase [Chthoniobacterales bacterium]
MRGRRLAVVLVAVYFVLMLFGGLPDHFILFPSKVPVDAGRATRRTIPFRDGELEIWTAKSQLAQRSGHTEVYVLRFYGNADRAEHWTATEAEMWNERAVEIWGVNYPGFGGSTGPARLTSIGPAALAAFDQLWNEANGRPVVLFGTSLGTAAALDVATHRQVAGLILHNPPALRQMILRGFGWWNLWLLAGPIAMQIPPELDSVANAKATRAPAIFLLAERDEVVAPRYHRLVVDAYTGEKRVITLRGAGHNTPIEGAGLADLYNALDWLLPRQTSR